MAPAIAVAACVGGHGGCSRDVRLVPVSASFDAADVQPDVQPDVPPDALPDLGAADVAGEARGDGGGATIDVGGPADVGGADGEAGTVACSGAGDPIRLPTATGPVCASALATRAHRFALCVCNSLGVIQPISTDVINSALGTIGGAPAAAIGTNSYLQSEAELRIGGALYVAGADGLTTSMRLDTAASLRVAGPTRITSSSAQVATDAYLGGDVSGILVVDGTLHLRPGAVTALAIIDATTTVREPVSVPPPCDCGPTFVDIPGAITSTMQRNDNAAAGLSPDRLATVTTSTVVDIPCGHYALSAINAEQGVFLAVHGRALVAVAGDVVLKDGLTVALDPGAELDLLIGGRFETSGDGRAIGSATPARFRIWASGSDVVVLNDRPTIGAMIHAPAALVAAPGGLELSGGLLAASLLSGQTNIHYDQAVLSAGVSCGEPTATAVP